MKKFVLAFALLGFANPSWAGCDWGTVSYVYAYNSPTYSRLFTIIDGTACFVSGNQNSIAAAAAILAQAKAGAANGMKGMLYTDPETPNVIEAAIQ